MPTRRNPLFRVVVLLGFGTIGVFIVLAGRREQTSANFLDDRKQSPQMIKNERMTRDVSALPEAVYQAAEAQGETDLELRKLKSKRHNGGTTPFEDLDDNTEKAKFYCSWGAPEAEAFPADESTLIVIGTVTDAKGYVSEDRSAAYSEYAIGVSEVIKGADKLTSNSIIAEREGARVVLPDGRRYAYWVMKQGTPQNGTSVLAFP